MNFNDKLNVTGHLEVIQIDSKTGKETVLFDDHNVITSGLGQSIAQMMSTRGCTLEPCIPEDIRFGPRNSVVPGGTTNARNETRTGGVNPPASSGGSDSDICYLIFEGKVNVHYQLLDGGQGLMKSKIWGNWRCECLSEDTNPGELVAPPVYGGYRQGVLERQGRMTPDSDNKGFTTDVYSIRRVGPCWSPFDQYGNRIFICEGNGSYEEEVIEQVNPSYVAEVRSKWEECYLYKHNSSQKRCQQRVLERVYNKFVGMFGNSCFTKLPKKCDGSY